MLELKDFDHLPQIDELIAQLVADRPGLIIVAGLDPRSIDVGQISPPLLPSGRSTFFGILVREILAAHRRTRAVFVSRNADAIRVPRGQRSQVEFRIVEPPLTYAEIIAQAATGTTELIVVDQLAAGAAVAALDAARRGKWVVAQLDCVFAGAAVARHLLDLGVSQDLLDNLTWIVTVQRLSTLCDYCREPANLEGAWFGALRQRYPYLRPDETFYGAAGCVHCHYTGRQGDAAIFDVFRVPENRATLFDQPSAFGAEEYALQFARVGRVAIDDVKRLEAEQLRTTWLLLTASERAQGRANFDLQRRLAELKVANRVLQQRTESLVSLQEIAQTLITSTELTELANRITHLGRRLGGWDKSILYVFQPDGSAEILSVDGWDPIFVHERLNRDEVRAAAFGSAHDSASEPRHFAGFPPGIPTISADVVGFALRAGLSIPLVAQQEIVGLMIVHSTHRPRFTAGEIALWQTFANQAALAIQRTSLVEALRQKIVQLEAAQVEIVKKERLESELELARGVQQSLLPRRFPEMPGYALAAHNEAARRVGGDLYDAFLLDANHFGVAIADVSDKGMPAALFMALTRSLLLAEARRELSPLRVATNVHHLLLELGEPDMFVTLFYGVIEMSSRKLTYIRAGHEKPLVLRDGAIMHLEGRGRFLGLLQEQALSLSEETFQLEQGDLLVLYTDGLVDAQSPTQEPFGAEAFSHLLLSNASLTPTELCTRAFQVLAEHQRESDPYDDMTMLVVQVADS